MQSLMSKHSLRTNPVCPFGDLVWKKYYWEHPRESISGEYWGEMVDPDGKRRNLMTKRERELQIGNLKPILDFLDRLEPGKILDVGCGPGFLLSVIGNKWDKRGYDTSKKALEHCRKYAEAYSGEFLGLFEGNFFDVVIMNHIIEHLPNPIDCLLEVKKVLKPGGYLVIATPDFDCACARHFGKKFRMLHDPGHISLFTSFSLVEMLETYLFDILFVEYPYFETRYFTRENLHRLFDTGEVSPPFYGNHVVVYVRNGK